ncbi:hypothetical protein OZX68_00120 [Streptococcaceae bacterium ESL0729]|nr:hypothetical protein OZX68_00120 [Streptococcaceae bacterium ESL0729]
MTREEFEGRIREELKMPFFKLQLEGHTYSEEEYQAFKRDLLDYYKDYVQDLDTDFQGGL